MTKFKFRLEAALRLRHLRVEGETAKLHALHTQRNRLLQTLAAITAERNQASTFAQQSDEHHAVDLRALSSFLLSTGARSKSISEALARTEFQIGEQVERLREAQKEERSLEKLRASRWREWDLQSQREAETISQELWLCSHTTSKEESDG